MSQVLKINLLCSETGLNAPRISEIRECLSLTAKRILPGGLTFEIAEFDMLASQRFNPDKSSIHLLILDSETATNENFQKNLAALSDTCIADKMAFAESPGLLKIILQPNELIQQPDSLKDLQAYEFFEYTGLRQNFRTLDIKNTETLLWSKILDVVYDLKDRQLVTKKEGADIQFAYLGNCSTDRLQNRDDFRRELQHFGFQILPVFELTNQSDDLGMLINNCLDRSQIIVQIIGSQYGKTEKGDKISMLEYENNMIREYLANNPQKMRLIWIPEDLKITDTRQELFINRLKRDNSASNSSIIESDPEEFKCLLAYHIRHQNPKTENPQFGKNLYLVRKNNSKLNLGEELLKKHSITLSLSEDTSGQLIQYSSHLKKLKTADGVLIDYLEPDMNWLQSKLSELVKTLGMGRKTPFKALGVLAKESPDIRELQNWLPSLEIIPADNLERLSAFLSKLNA